MPHRRQATISAVVITLLVLFAACTAGRRVSMLVHPGPSRPIAYISPVKHTGALLGPVGGTDPVVARHGSTAGDSPAEAGWYVAQWSNPNPLDEKNLPPPGESPSGVPDAACNASADAFRGDPALAPVWSVATPSVRLCGLHSTTGPALGYFQLAMDGGSALACGTEQDFFLSPVGGAYHYTPYNFDSGADGWSVSGLASFNVSLDVSLDYLRVGQRCSSPPDCGASPDYAYMTVGVPMHNNVSKEQLFFQVSLFDSRNGKCGAGQFDPCDAAGSMSWYFRTLPVLGSNIAAAAVPGGGCLRAAGDRQHLRMQLLGRLQEAIQEAKAQFNADGDASHWFVSGFYVGPGIQGDVAITATVGNVQIEADVV